MGRNQYQREDRSAAIRRRQELVRMTEMIRSTQEPEPDVNDTGNKHEQETSGVATNLNEAASVSPVIQEKRSEKEAEILMDNVKIHGDKETGNVSAVQQGKRTGIIEKLFSGEEIDPELQEHLRNEFDVYADQKLKMIANGADVIVPGQKAITKEEKKKNFLHKKAAFQKKMQGWKKTYWGTKRYERLLAKWFPDYQDVIQNKITGIKANINQSIVQTNKSIQDVISKLTEAINSASADADTSLKLLDEANTLLAQANEHRQSANKTLAEYDPDNLAGYMSGYDQVILTYTQLISGLTKNIDGIKQDQVRLNQIISGLSGQQLQLSQFNAKVNASTDVLELISLEKNEFPTLIDNARLMVATAGKADRTAYTDEAGSREQLKASQEQLTTLDAGVEVLKQNEIRRREEEKRKKEEEIKRKKEEEERLKKAQQQKAAAQTSAADSNEPPIFIKKTTVTTTIVNPSGGKAGDIIKTRGGKDYTKESWNEKNSLKESGSSIDESNFSQTDKTFFAKYKKTCDAYLESWYKGKDVSKKLTGDMFVNAAKRIYIKYGDLSYVVPAEMALVQSRLETGLGTTGAGNYNNPFNVGEYDTGPTSWTKDITSPETGIYFYMDVMANDYLSAKTADQLLQTQGVSFVNEKGSRYASAPRYEMTLKAMMGQVGLVRDSKQPQVPVGRNKQKNDGTESATFVRNMLKQLGYTQADLGDAIEAFQKTEMFPPLTPEQQKLVNKMNSGDRKNFDIQEKTGVDGVADPKGNTAGLLYYMTGMGNTLTNFSGTSVTVTDPAKGKVKEFYEQYKDGKIDMIALGVDLIPYCRYYADDVLDVMDQLGWGTEDNLAYVLANKATDQQLKYFDNKLLQRMKSALDPANNWTSVDKKKTQWERIKTALGENSSSSETSSDAKKDNTKDTKNTKRVSIPVDFRISASVGAGGENVAEDVKKIQDLLINFNYLKENDSEVSLVAQTIKDKPGTKLKESQLSNTIAAIKQFQKYGATTGTTLSKQDGKVDKAGGTITAMRELNSVDVNYKDQKFEEDIPDVLTKAQWVSQFRYGYNFRDGEDSLEKEYAEFVKKETGLSDPADLGSAKDASIKKIKDGYEKKGTWFDQKATLSDHGLKMSQKSRSYKPNYVCCWDAANTMLGFSGTSEQGSDFKIQTYVADQVTQTINGKSVTKVENGKFTNQMPLGIKYIDGQLKAGHAVFVGVEKGKAKTQNEFVTDHYIVIVGKHKDDSGNYYYSYFDPGTANEGYDTKKNRLTIGADKTSVQNASYKLSQIRTNNE